eukprot:TRINITY_DN42023_c0_g1_i2.p2 TRINITY_DN42023_c0_g1~~TRINITY_DN42023_c0_g1_i2.p2  ORF type:complete len:198 (+),score=-13.16 TRINITY_DN42023_c0_g1_i2:269-862(+)
MQYHFFHIFFVSQNCFLKLYPKYKLHQNPPLTLRNACILQNKIHIQTKYEVFFFNITIIFLRNFFNYIASNSISINAKYYLKGKNNSQKYSNINITIIVTNACIYHQIILQQSCFSYYLYNILTLKQQQSQCRYYNIQMYETITNALTKLLVQLLSTFTNQLSKKTNIYLPKTVKRTLIKKDHYRFTKLTPHHKFSK